MSGPDGAQRKQNLHNRWADQIAANRRIEQAAELQAIRDNAAAARGNDRRRLQDSSSSIPEDLTRRVMSGPDGAQRKQNLHNRWADQIAANRRIEQAAELQTIRDNAAAARGTGTGTGTWSPSRRRLDSSAFPPFAALARDIAE